MNVIVTGPDNGGKTTLADILVREGGYRYYHSGGPPRSSEEELRFLNEQFNLCLQRDQSYVLDRISGIAQQVYRDRIGEELLCANVRTIMALEHRPIIVYCRPPNDRLMAFENFTWRPEETDEEKQNILDNQHKFIDRYDAVMSKLPHVIYDFTDEAACKGLIPLLINRQYADLLAIEHFGKGVPA